MQSAPSGSLPGGALRFEGAQESECGSFVQIPATILRNLRD